jgi:hypothetical protein
LEDNMAHATKRIHWAWWPIIALWRLLAIIVELTGRFIAIVLGLVLMLAGFLVGLTIVGAIVGIPLFIIGFMLVVRGIF